MDNNIIGTSLFIVYLAAKHNFVEIQRQFLKEFTKKVNGVSCTDKEIDIALDEINLMAYETVVKTNRMSILVNNSDAVKSLYNCGNKIYYKIMDDTYGEFINESNERQKLCDNSKPTIDTAKQEKTALETKLSTLVSDFEETYGVEITNLLISHDGTLSRKTNKRAATIKTIVTI